MPSSFSKIARWRQRVDMLQNSFLQKLFLQITTQWKFLKFLKFPTEKVLVNLGSNPWKKHIKMFVFYKVAGSKTISTKTDLHNIFWWLLSYFQLQLPVLHKMFFNSLTSFFIILKPRPTGLKEKSIGWFPYDRHSKVKSVLPTGLCQFKIIYFIEIAFKSTCNGIS